jgi:uncharacterized protein YjbI with pentapeptide repeats
MCKPGARLTLGSLLKVTLPLLVVAAGARWLRAQCPLPEPIWAPLVFRHAVPSCFSQMQGAVVRDADLDGWEMLGVNLSGGSLRNVTLRRAELRGLDLSQCLVQDCDFNGADLSLSRMAGASLRGCRFVSADLTGAGLTGATYDAVTRWPAGFDPAAHGARRVE